MPLQAAELTESFITQPTLVSCVDAHVNIYTVGVLEHFVTHVTSVWFLSTVNSAVKDKVSGMFKSFAENTTLKLFSLSRMNLHVYV